MGSPDNSIRLRLQGCSNNVEQVIDIIRNIDDKQTSVRQNYDNKLADIQNQFYINRHLDKQYVDALNTEIAKQLEEDNNYINQIKIQNVEGVRNIGTLVNDIKKIQGELLVDKAFTSMKSLNNQQISVSNIPNTRDYLIHLNDKCLDVKDKFTYSVQPCNEDSMTQRFSLNPVNDNNTFYSHFKEYPAILNDNNQYPYNLIKSKSTNLCLQEDNGNIIMNTCKSLSGQKWRGFKTNVGNNCPSQK
jgi:hypothetical protein